MADAAGGATIGLDKSIIGGQTTVAPGQTFTYLIRYQCSVLDTDLGCVNAQMSDPIPAPFEVLSATTTPASASMTTVTDSNVVVKFTSPLGDGTVGSFDGATGETRITVKLPDDASYDYNGVSIDNIATGTADNADTQTATAPITPVLPLHSGAEASKEFEPALDRATPGATTTLALSGTNTSNGSVDSLTLTDPASTDGTGTNPFTYLEITEVSEIVWPEGAATATIEYWDGSSWGSDDVVTKPGAANAPPSDALGIRVTFAGADGANIARGAEGGLVLELTQRDNVTELDGTTVLNNTVIATVDVNDETTESEPGDADYTIVNEDLVVEPSKQFADDTILPGGETTVTIGIKNTNPVSVDTLSITEPASGTFDPRLEFTGFTSAVQFPSGATSGRLVFTYEDTAGGTQILDVALTDGGDFPDLPADFATLQSFSVSFASATGVIVPGGESPVTFGVRATEGMDAGTVIDNVVAGTATDGDLTATDTAEDSITTDVFHLDLETRKSISPGTIWGYAGEVATIQLPTTLLESSTANADIITVNDPELDDSGVPVASDWWDHFRPTQVTKTAVPANSTLTVNYYDTVDEEWKVLVADVVGPATLTQAIPADVQDRIGGFQFVFTNTDDGFAPGTTVKPNITTELRESLPSTDDGGTDISVQNCSAATAEASDAEAGAASVDPCPEIEILAPTPGEYDFLDKTWTAPTDGLVSARSGENATSRLSWSTSGLGNVDEYRLSDTRTGADPVSGPVDAVEDTVYEAFNLVAINAITADMDPYLKWDYITDVQLWNGTAWVAANNATGLPYTGSMPRIALTAAEQLSTTAVRLVYAENAAARAASDDPEAPAEGSGVARSFDRRLVDLQWQIRDTRRSDDAVAVLQSETYNTGAAGDVNNIAGAAADIGDETITDEDSDIISILDQPLVTHLTKEWSGGPLGLPAEGTDPADYPSGRVTLTATNETAAKVDELIVTDALAGGDSPFDVFNLKKIVSVPTISGSVPSQNVVVLTLADGSTLEKTPAEAVAMTRDELLEVVGIQVKYAGRITAGASAKIVFDLQLRATLRESGDPVTLDDAPVNNEAGVVVNDAGGENGVHSVDDDDAASIDVVEQSIDIITSKSFNPGLEWATILPEEVGYADEPWDAVGMTLSAQPSGSARPVTMTVTDDTATFWNAYKFAGFGSGFSFAAPIDRVRVDALVGGTFVAAADGSSVTLAGAHWETGVASTTLTLPAGVDVADVQGLRFTFTRADGAQWENPANPTQTIPLQVKRRAYLASDNTVPVPSDAATKPAPGETVAGDFTNTVASDVTSPPLSADGDPLTADDEFTATMEYREGETEIAVSKTPNLETKAPGQVIPFVLTMENTASTSAGMEASILDPVVVDTIPTDDEGHPWLIFDTAGEADDDTAAHVERYAYSYQAGAKDPAAPNTRMPVDPSEITVDEITNSDGEVTSIRFSFPTGTVLMPGERYQITINMMFRPGVVAGQVVDNKMSVSAAEDFAKCNLVRDPEDVDVATCDATGSVTVQDTGALRGQKTVKSDDDELGVTNVTDPSLSDQCAATRTLAGDDYYAYSCVPVTKPLTTETWFEWVQNTGTQPMDQVITIDRLPTPGDKGVLLKNQDRNTQWQPTYIAGSIASVSEPGYRVPDSEEYFYTSATDLCTSDLQPVTGTPCADDAWLPLTDDTPVEDIAAIKTVYHFDENTFKPGEVLGYTLKTRTPAQSAAAGSDTVAWNSIATGARTVTADGGHYDVLASEARKVGVALATGPLAVQKSVTGPGAAYAPDTFDVLVTCTVSGDGITEELEPLAFTVAVGDPDPLGDYLFPYGASCVVSEESGVNGETTSTPGDAVTVGRGEVVDALQIVNDYQLTTLRVTKTVDGALDAEGEPVEYGSFPISAVCTFLGDEVLAEGYDESPMTAELESGDEWLLAGLPVGTTCEVTETDAQGASTTIAVNPVIGPPTGEAEEATSTDVVLTAASTDGSPVVSVDITNTFELGAIAIEKIVDGDAASAIPADTVFTFAVNCIWSRYEFSSVVYDGTVEVEAGQTVTIDTLPLGAACAVTETDSVGATSTEISPEDWARVGTVAEPLQVVAVNTYDAGSLHVDKEITGDGAELWSTGEFEVTLACTLNGQDVVIPDGATRALTAPDALTADYTGLPAGAECVLSETGTGGATTSEIVTTGGEPSDGSFEVIGDEQAGLRVINTYDVGALTLVKEVTGTGVAALDETTFEFTIGCVVDVDGEDVSIEIPGGATRTLTYPDDLEARFDNLPVGATCELRETEDGNAASTVITPNDGEDTTVGIAVVPSKAESQFTVVNTFTAVTPTPEPSQSETSTPDPSESETPTPSPEPSESETSTPDPSESVTPTPSPEPTDPETATPSPEPSDSETATPSPEPTDSETATSSPEPTDSETATAGPTDTDPATPAPETSGSAQPLPATGTSMPTGAVALGLLALLLGALVLIARRRTTTR